MKNKIVLFSSDLKYGGTPLSLLTITSLLDTKKYDIRIITHLECPDYEKEILEQCKDALCFGVTCITGGPIKSSLAVSRVVKEKYPSLPIIWGGWQAITLPEVTLSSPYVDYLCTGQGERTFYEFVKMLEGGDYKNIDSIDGLSYKKKGAVYHNPKRQPEDLNNLPDFDLDLIDWKKYLEVTDYGSRALRIITSYGCPNRCGFCCELYNTARIWKALSAERIISFLKRLRSKVDFDSLIIGDSNFFVNEKRVIEFCNGLIENDFNISYGSVNGTADILVKYKGTTWELLRKSGLYNILLGAESADNETLQFIGKRAKVEDTYRLAEICKRYGIKLIASTMIGLPIPAYFTENKQKVLAREFKELTKLYRNLYELDPNNFFVLFFYSPLPSTPLYERAIELGFVPPEDLVGWSDHDLEAVHFSWVKRKNLAKRRALNYVSLMLSKNATNFNKALPWHLGIITAPILSMFRLLALVRLKLNYYDFSIDCVLFNMGIRLFHKMNRALKLVNIIDPL